LVGVSKAALVPASLFFFDFVPDGKLPKEQPMGSLSWLLRPSSVRVVKHWSLSVKLPQAVKTSTGRRFKYVCCAADIHYCVRGDKLEVVNVCLSDPFVWSSRRSGERCKADFALRRMINRVLPKQIDTLIASDGNLKRVMWAKAADLRAQARLEQWKTASRTHLTGKSLRGKKCKALLDAAREQRAVAITYNGGENPGTKREIIPKEFFKVKGFRTTYLLAYDFRRRTDRSFEVSLIEIG
jgi:hypothetical protein